MRTITHVAAILLAVLGCNREEVLAQQDVPDPIPPSTVDDIDESRTAPERGQVPFTVSPGGERATPRDGEQPPAVILVVPRAAAGDREQEPERFYYGPAPDPRTSELYEAAREGGGPGGGLEQRQPKADVVCEADLEPIDLASRVEDLEELSRDAVGAEYKANLKRAAKMLEEANADIRKKTRELEQALARGERLHRQAMEMATETN